MKIGLRYGSYTEDVSVVLRSEVSEDEFTEDELSESTGEVCGEVELWYSDTKYLKMYLLRTLKIDYPRVQV